MRTSTAVAATAVAVVALNGGVLLISSRGTLFSHIPFRTGCPKSREKHYRRRYILSTCRPRFTPSKWTRTRAPVCAASWYMAESRGGPAVQRDGTGIISCPAVSAEFIRFRITRVKRRNLIKSRSPTPPTFIARSLRRSFFRWFVSNVRYVFNEKSPRDIPTCEYNGDGLIDGYTSRGKLIKCPRRSSSHCQIDRAVGGQVERLSVLTLLRRVYRFPTSSRFGSNSAFLSTWW